jgi:N-acetylglucosaminyl-diphospho-decaprenol L-rhamnosyltransferase
MREVGGMDEDFFLYHEEVALSRVALRRGWRVEFDPSVSVVHRHPLQNRAISPKMRVITRHSKLLYFRKHLPARQFRILSAIVRLEAAIRGRWSAIRGRRDDVRSWAVIGEVARRLRRGESVRGGDVLDLAESVVRAQSPPVPRPDRAARGARDSRHSADSPERSSRPAWMRRRSRHTDGAPLRSRKEGSA